MRINCEYGLDDLSNDHVLDSIKNGFEVKIPILHETPGYKINILVSEIPEGVEELIITYE